MQTRHTAFRGAIPGGALACGVARFRVIFACFRRPRGEDGATDKKRVALGGCRACPCGGVLARAAIPRLREVRAARVRGIVFFGSFVVAGDDAAHGSV